MSILLLSAGFYSNFWQVADQDQFIGHHYETERYVWGRLARSRQLGIFSDGGLTGVGIPTATPTSESDITLYNQYLAFVNPVYIAEMYQPGGIFDHQYEAFVDSLDFGAYAPYRSQIGGQGMVFGLLDRLIPLESRAKLQFFQLLTSVLTAGALTLIILWFSLEFGSSSALFALLFTVLSQWLVLIGRSVWWGTWAYYLPMLAVMYFLRKRGVSAHRPLVTFGIIVFISVFVKCLINGYEYITTTLIMMMVPFVYYGVLEGLSIRGYLKGALIAISASCLAVFSTFFILSVQIASVDGSLADGVRHIVNVFFKRTHADPSAFLPIYTASLDASTAVVVYWYVRGTFFDFNNYFYTSNAFVAKYLFQIRYAYLLVGFLLVSVLLFYRENRRVDETQRRKSTALILATWFSILAPLSWFIIFKSHSYLHLHLNFVLWHMPFTLFGFALCGLAAGRVFPDLVRLLGRSSVASSRI